LCLENQRTRKVIDYFKVWLNNFMQHWRLTAADANAPLFTASELGTIRSLTLFSLTADTIAQMNVGMSQSKFVPKNLKYI
jgi:hypothetical protein